MRKMEPQEKLEAHNKAMRLMLDRRIFGNEVTLNDLAKISLDMGEIIDPGDLAAWTFVSPNFVYTGD